MNILLLYSSAIYPSDQGFYSFYGQLVGYLNHVGIRSRLCVCALTKSKEQEYVKVGQFAEDEFCQLPDCYKWNTLDNRKVLISYLNSNRIDCIFNLMHANHDLSNFLLLIRRDVSCKCINLIHNRPDLILYNKRRLLSHMHFNEISNWKIGLQKIGFPLYMFLLDRIVYKRNLASYKVHDAIVLLSSSYIDIYKKIMRRSVDNVYAIPNPLPEIVSNIPVSKKRKEIIFVGNLTEIKRVDRLLRIWKIIYKRLSDWSLIILGDGPERKRLEKMSQDLDLERVIFCGQKKSIPYIDSARILCLVSSFEGLPTVFLEAMSLSVIPIGYDTFPAIYDLIDSGINGYIVPFEDMGAYASNLVNIAENEDLRVSLADQAKLKSKKFEIELIAKEWISVFKALKLL